MTSGASATSSLRLPAQARGRRGHVLVTTEEGRSWAAWTPPSAAPVTDLGDRRGRRGRVGDQRFLRLAKGLRAFLTNLMVTNGGPYTHRRGHVFGRSRFEKHISLRIHLWPVGDQRRFVTKSGKQLT